MDGHALRRILVIDDDPLIGAATRLALEGGGGYRVELCESGVDALAAARRFRPDLVLLDVMIPHLDGPSTLAALRRAEGFADLPVVFLTGRTEPAALAHYRALGARDVIAKPFDPGMLAHRVREIWTRPDG